MTDQTLTTGAPFPEFTAQLASAQPARAAGRGRARRGAGGEPGRDGRERDGSQPRYADRHDALATLAASCDAQRTTLLALIDADAAGFLPLQRAYAIPKDDPTRAARLAGRGAHGVPCPAGHAGALRAGGAAAARRSEHGQPPPALGRRVRGGAVQRGGGGGGTERAGQHRPARAGRPRRDRGARRAPARDRGAVLRADRGRGARRAARGG